jgi:hypothetical protein
MCKENKKIMRKENKDCSGDCNNCERRKKLDPFELMERARLMLEQQSHLAEHIDGKQTTVEI